MVSPARHLGHLCQSSVLMATPDATATPMAAIAAITRLESSQWPFVCFDCHLFDNRVHGSGSGSGMALALTSVLHHWMVLVVSLDSIGPRVQQIRLIRLSAMDLSMSAEKGQNGCDYAHTS